MNEQISRRVFLLSLLSLLGGLMGADLLAMVMSPTGKKISSLVTFAKPQEIPKGSVLKGPGVWLVSDDDGFFALSSRCSHLGCEVEWVDAEKIFRCPCHSSKYDRLGKVLAGPAAASLKTVKVSQDRQEKLVADLEQEVNAKTRFLPSA